MTVGAVPTFDAGGAEGADLAEAKGGRRVSVCLPARDEEATVGQIVRTVRRDLVERCGLVDEVLVVDDGSLDATAAVARSAGARVVPGEGWGKGRAMWEGLRACDGELIVFCDADLRNFQRRLVIRLLAPLLAEAGLGFVKACYNRPLGGRAGQGGRVTELVAKPLLRTLFPHLSSVHQPLGGECAGRREVLAEVPFVEGYGVDIALVIDVAARFGTACIAQVDVGERVHRNRSLEELGPQAEAVLRTVLARAGLGSAVPECGPLAQARESPRPARQGCP